MSRAQWKWVTKVCCQMGENDDKINVVMWKMFLLRALPDAGGAFSLDWIVLNGWDWSVGKNEASQYEF